MFLYVHLKDGSMVSISDVEEITRVDPFKTLVVKGIIFDYDIVDYIWYLNDNIPAGYNHGSKAVYIFDDNHFVCASYDIIKYIQPIKVVDGVAYNV